MRVKKMPGDAWDFSGIKFRNHKKDPDYQKVIEEIADNIAKEIEEEILEEIIILLEKK